MRYKKVKQMGMDLIIVTHKGVVMSLAEGADWISIYSCNSQNKGKGEVQEAINIVKKDYSHKRLCGSLPLNPIMEHIYKKCGVIYDELGD
jgi:hypothetical protein